MRAWQTPMRLGITWAVGLALLGCGLVLGLSEWGDEHRHVTEPLTWFGLGAILAAVFLGWRVDSETTQGALAQEKAPASTRSRDATSMLAGAALAAFGATLMLSPRASAVLVFVGGVAFVIGLVGAFAGWRRRV